MQLPTLVPCYFYESKEDTSCEP
jgi:hypothetical protein